MTTINTVPRPAATPTITFDWNNKSDPFTYTVGATTYAPPGAHFTAAFCQITFAASAVFYDDRLPSEFFWDFGDNHFGYGESVAHTYKHDNLHTQVSLCVTDNTGGRWYTRNQLYLKSVRLSILAPTLSALK